MRTGYLQTHHVAGVDVIPIPPFTLSLKGNQMMKHWEGGLGGPHFAGANRKGCQKGKSRGFTLCAAGTRHGRTVTSAWAAQAVYVEMSTVLSACARYDLGKGGFSHCPWTGNMLLWE